MMRRKMREGGGQFDGTSKCIGINPNSGGCYSGRAVSARGCGGTGATRGCGAAAEVVEGRRETGGWVGTVGDISTRCDLIGIATLNSIPSSPQITTFNTEIARVD